MKHVIAYYYSSNNTDDLTAMAKEIREFANKYGLFPVKEMNDVSRSYTWNTRHAWDSIRLGVSTNQVSHLFLRNFYSIERNHKRIVEFLRSCRKRDVKVYFVEHDWWNKAQDEDSNELDNYISTIEVIAKHISEYKSNKRYTSKGRGGRKPIPKQCRNKILEAWKAGKPVRWIHENIKYTRNSNYYKVSRRMIYYIIERDQEPKDERQ